jgi:glucose-1-phosphatase
MNKISAVLFDLGNVLVRIDFDMFWRSLGFSEKESRAPFLSGYKTYTRQYETGLIQTDDYLKGLHAVFDERFTIVQLEQAFTNIILDPIEGMSGIVNRVSRNCQTALVSNTNEIHFRFSLSKFDFLHELHKHYLSYRLKVMKPSKGFYEAIIKDLKMEPSEILFIDDINENVIAARNSGIQAMEFEGPDKLEKKMAAFGIL